MSNPNFDDGNRLNDLVHNSGYSDGDLEEMVPLLAKGLFTVAASVPTAQFRATIELIQAVRKFDKVSTELITTTNNLTERIRQLTIWGLVVAGLGAVVAAASLIVSVVALIKSSR